MALNEAFTPHTSAPALLQKVQVAQIVVNIAETGTLAQGDWLNLYTGEAGDVVLGGSVTTVTAGTATADYDIGITGSATSILADGQADATAGTVVSMAAANTTNVVLGTSSVQFLCQAATADIAAGKWLVTLMILKSGDFTG
jgi:hypothetical protein